MLLHIFPLLSGSGECILSVPQEGDQKIFGVALFLCNRCSVAEFVYMHEAIRLVENDEGKFT